MSQPTASDLARVPLFAGMTDDVRAALAEHFTIEEHEPGHRIVIEGGPGYAFYVVAEGSLSVSHGVEVVQQLGAGDFFGEFAIIDDGRRSATVTAETPVVVYELFGADFRVMESTRPDVAAAIHAAMDERRTTGSAAD